MGSREVPCFRVYLGGLPWEPGRKAWQCGMLLHFIPHPAASELKGLFDSMIQLYQGYDLVSESLLVICLLVESHSSTLPGFMSRAMEDRYLQ